MNEPRERVPQNAEGDFYVEAGLCMRCCIPHDAAPVLLNDPREEFRQCFFRRQPQSWEEILKAVEAVSLSDVGALRYGGTDPRILWLLREKRSDHCCDHPLHAQRGGGTAGDSAF